MFRPPPKSRCWRAAAQWKVRYAPLLSTWCFLPLQRLRARTAPIVRYHHRPPATRLQPPGAEQFFSLLNSVHCPESEAYVDKIYKTGRQFIAAGFGQQVGTRRNIPSMLKEKRIGAEHHHGHKPAVGIGSNFAAVSGAAQIGRQLFQIARQQIKDHGTLVVKSRVLKLAQHQLRDLLVTMHMAQMFTLEFAQHHFDTASCLVQKAVQALAKAFHSRRYNGHIQGFLAVKMMENR